ncbi:MAG: hypothetical protein JSV61_00610 [Anaerolineales bacterium]|nr:MAG: hypothetical protein JSV61_00610 [Anaerolineales bacterium]
MNEINIDMERCAGEGPQSALEKRLIAEYLSMKGYSTEDLVLMPEEQAKDLMQEACSYASLKLAEVESKTKFRKEIHYTG